MSGNINTTLPLQLNHQELTSHSSMDAQQLIQVSKDPVTGNIDTEKLLASLAAIAQQDFTLAGPLIQAVKNDLDKTNPFDASHFARDMQTQIAWLGEQYLGVAKGAGSMLWDTAKGLGTLTFGAVEYTADTSPAGIFFDTLKGMGVISDTLPVPSFKDGLETIEQLASVSKAIADDPSLIWDAMTDPVVKRWAEGRYGEALGYAGMEIATIVLTPTKLAKLSKLSNLNKLNTADELINALSFAKEINQHIPGDLAKHFDELVIAKRASDELDLVVEAARKSDTLPEFLYSGKLTQAELEILANTGKITPEEFVNSLSSVKSAKVPEGLDTQATSNTKGHIDPENDSATGASTSRLMMLL